MLKAMRDCAESVMGESLAIGRSGRCPILALVALLASYSIVAAEGADATYAPLTLQSAPVPKTVEAPAAAEPETEDVDAAEPPSSGETVAQEPLSEEQAAALRDALNTRFDGGPSAPRQAGQAGASSLNWKQTIANGSTSYTVNRTLPVQWDTRIGADLGVINSSGARIEPQPSALVAPEKNTGAAWANVQVPGVASFDTRVGMGAEPSTFGVSRTVPIRGATSLTLQDSYAVTEAVAGRPVGLTATGASSVWSNDRQVKLNIGTTGTSFGAGTTSSSIDGVTHNRFSAEQKLFDKFNVTTTFNDLGAPTSSRGITAGFKTQW